MYEPIVPMRAYEQIVRQIEARIQNGNLRIGDRLPSERKLAEQFEASRSVIREAMRNLEARGLLEVRQGSGIYVGAQSINVISQTFTMFLRLEETSIDGLDRVRCALELLSASMAAENATDKEIEEIEECLMELSDIKKQGLIETMDYLSYSAKDFQFHSLVAEASHNIALVTLLRPILDLTIELRREILGPGDTWRSYIFPKAVNEEHVAIFEGIVSRDPDRTKSLMEHHLQRTMKTISKLSASQRSSPRPAGRG